MATKKTLHFFLFFVLFCTISHAGSVSLNTYIPGPLGAYERLQLVPRPPAPPCGAGDVGTFYVDINQSELRYCDGVRFEPVAGPWTQDSPNNFVYLTDMAVNPNLKVGIGTITPQEQLHISHPGGTGITNMATLLIENLESDTGGSTELFFNEIDAEHSGIRIRYRGSTDLLRFHAFDNADVPADIPFVKIDGVAHHVGLGTLNTTNSKLTVGGHTQDDQQYTMKVLNSNGTPLFVARNDQRVGIRVDPPKTFLHANSFNSPGGFNGPFRGQIHIGSALGPPGTLSKITFAPTNLHNSLASFAGRVVQAPFGAELHFTTMRNQGAAVIYSTPMMIDRYGHIGIGTILPNEALEVSGPTVLNGLSANIDSGLVNISSYLNNTHGLLIGWNRSGGFGETDFITNRGGGGVGGFRFYNYANDDSENILLTLRGNGRSGIRTTAPDAALSIQEANVSGQNRWMSFMGAFGFVAMHINHENNGIAFIERGLNFRSLFLESGGNIGINTTTPNARLEVVGTSLFNGTTANIGGANITYLNSSRRLLFGWNRSGGQGEANFITNRGPGGSLGGFRFIDYDNAGVERVLVTMAGTGNVGIGNNVTALAPPVALYVDGNIEYTGLLIPPVSDERVKENMKIVQGPLEKLENIRGFYFNKIGSDQKDIGVSAQDVQKSFPQIVDTIDNESGALGVRYMELIPVLIEAIKELEQENIELQAHNELLKTKFRTLKDRLK